MSILKPTLCLLAVTTVSALLLGVLYNITREPVERQATLRQAEIISILLPGTSHTYEESIYKQQDMHPNIHGMVIAYDANNQPLGYVITSQGPGYAGPVVIMAGFDTDGILTGISVLQHRETPGLGTAILNPVFLAQFEGRTETMTVARMPSGDNEIAALASATISTVAVVEGVNAAMEFIRNYVNDRYDKCQNQC